MDVILYPLRGFVDAMGTRYPSYHCGEGAGATVGSVK